VFEARIISFFHSREKSVTIHMGNREGGDLRVGEATEARTGPLIARSGKSTATKTKITRQTVTAVNL